MMQVEGNALGRASWAPKAQDGMSRMQSCFLRATSLLTSRDIRFPSTAVPRK